MLMMKLTGVGFSTGVSAGVGGAGAGSFGLAISTVRVKRFVATIRQVAGEQVSRKPGVSASEDSPCASASSLNNPSPQRTALES